VNTLTFIAPTKRRKMTKARAANIFLVNNGRCYLCGLQIRDGEPWEVEHPDALSLGGSDDDADLRPVHVRCHKGKTAAEAPVRAKRNDLITKGYVGNKRKSRWPSRPFPKRQKRMEATNAR
jgi:hypothetical protein